MDKPIKVGYALALFHDDGDYDFGNQQYFNCKFKNKGKELELPIPFIVLSKENEAESIRSLLLNILSIYASVRLSGKEIPEDKYDSRFSKELSALLQKYNL